jgi:ABC-type transporter Mla maintaining outer membrane lipid asymmetry ATPase subunit MlaF
MSEEASHPAVIKMRGVQVATLRDISLIVLEDVNWSVQPGEFWVVAGPQHSGKSDLLLHAAGLMNPVNGTCCLFGRDSKEFDETQFAVRQRIGFVFPEGKLFNQFTLAENVALPLRYHRDLPDDETARIVEPLLELLELKPFAKMKPGNVASVWRQRAALARALILKPELLLLDNPNGGLIERHRRWLVNFLDQLWRGHDFFGGRPMTIVATTDDLRAWEHSKRRFAALHEGNFTVLGAWGGENFTRHHAVRELLSEQMEVDKQQPVAPPDISTTT